MTTKVTVEVPDYVPLVRVVLRHVGVRYEEKDETLLNNGQTGIFHVYGTQVLEVREDLD